ncbi:hypothetical protein CEXT_740751 [Caerostris extrusa]|uniref:Uncharacterized protein n=1 Tax=Caerostris extrusa TaxID=172846 RepID=A0AAV4V6W2_CAEEX|nr:hypothetical protein CEXT_740751 [Caerostris extrusa]
MPRKRVYCYGLVGCASELLGWPSETLGRAKLYGIKTKTVKDIKSSVNHSLVWLKSSSMVIIMCLNDRLAVGVTGFLSSSVGIAIRSRNSHFTNVELLRFACKIASEIISGAFLTRFPRSVGLLRRALAFFSGVL